jgi:hypothetical protein
LALLEVILNVPVVGCAQRFPQRNTEREKNKQAHWFTGLYWEAGQAEWDLTT